MSTIKTTAFKEYNVAVVKQSGRVGTVRYFNRYGLTYSRSASNSQVTNRRTRAQMTQRLHVSSLSSLYSALGTHLQGAFPNKAKNNSEFNVFMKLIQDVSAYMTKQERELGYSYGLPVIVAMGTLPEITTTVKQGYAVSSIKIGSFNPSSAIISDLYAAIVSANSKLKEDDKITIVILRQEGNYCKPLYIRIYLNHEDTTPLSAFGSISVIDGKLAYAVTGDVCVGIIHTSKEGDVSISRLAASESMQQIVDNRLTEEAFIKASESYGKSKEKFLFQESSIVTDSDDSIGNGDSGNG